MLANRECKRSVETKLCFLRVLSNSMWVSVPNLRLLLSVSLVVVCLRIMENLSFDFYQSLVMPSLVFSCLVLSVQLPPGSALSHLFSSSECFSCFHSGMTGNSSCLCCFSSRQVHWDPAGPVLKTELWRRK